MPSLNRHGIGSGKYRIGGTYPENILRVDETKGRGQQLLDVNIVDNDTSFRCYALVRDNEGNIYVGGSNSSGVPNLKKYSASGELIWAVDMGTHIYYMAHHPGSDILYAYTITSRQIHAVDLVTGEVRLSIQCGGTGNPIQMQATEDYIIVGFYVSSSTTITDLLTIYTHDGNVQYQFNIQSLRTFYFVDNSIYAADRTTLFKMTLTGVRTWAYTITALDTSYTNNHSITIDNKDNVWLLTSTFWSTNNTTGSYLYVLKRETGEVVRIHQRSNDSGGAFYPNNRPNNADTTLINKYYQINLPSGYNGKLLNNGVDYPCTVFAESGGSFVRSLNDVSDVYGSFALPTGNSFNAKINYSPMWMDENKIIYIGFQQRLQVYDPKTYYKIQY